MQPLPHFSNKKTLSLTDLETQREHVAALENQMQSIGRSSGERYSAQRFAYNNAEGLDVDFVAASETGNDMLVLSGGEAQPYVSQPDIFGVICRVRALSMREINSGWGNRAHIYRGDAAIPRANCPANITDVEQAEASGVATCGLMTSLQWAASGVDAPYIRYGVGYIPPVRGTEIIEANYNASGVADNIGTISGVSYDADTRAPSIKYGGIIIGAPDSTASGVMSWGESWGAVRGTILTARTIGSTINTSVIDDGLPTSDTPAWWDKGRLCINLDAIRGGGEIGGLMDYQGRSVKWDDIGTSDSPTLIYQHYEDAMNSINMQVYAYTSLVSSVKYLGIRVHTPRSLS